MRDNSQILSNYYKILNDKINPRFHDCKKIPVIFKKNESIKNLWNLHDNGIKNWKKEENKPMQSLLDLKIEIAKRIFHKCCFCEKKCHVDRSKQAGNCGVKQPMVSSEFLHLGEERDLIPSHTIFFSGCTFHCVFCQNWDISQKICGLNIKPYKLAELIKFRKTQGAKNVNWVGGDPTPNLHYILQVLKELNVNTPQIWNSNMYCSTETMKLLDGVIDLYLTDFKYGNDKCANRLSKVDNYIKIIERNHKIAYKNGDMIIRHLVMPNHVECCSKPIVNWISKNLPNAIVNIMGQYRPEYKANDYDDISRIVSKQEVLQVKNYK